MIPKIVLTRKYNTLTISNGNDKLSINFDGKGLNITQHNLNARYILYIPYSGVYVKNCDFTPLKHNSTSYVQVITVHSNYSLTYDIQLSSGKISLVKHLTSEEMLRGFVSNGNAVQEFHQVIRAIIHNYLNMSTPIYTAYLKLSIDDEFMRIFEELKCKVLKNIIIFYSAGFSVFIKRVGIKRFNLSISSTSAYIDKFRSIVTELLRSALIIHDVRFGRINNDVKILLDLYLPCTIK
ncbi:MAG: hypothetical protein B6V02_00835 [Thermoprotei archaeon ex4572_64]|nr:MAG: hypothetical protein B6V02_00835 [Thermoprotei archaeon ex4572_64]